MPGLKWDICAVGLSSVCLVHCLVIAASSALLPFASLHVENHLVHIGMVLLVAPVSLWVIWQVQHQVQNRDRGAKMFVSVAFVGLLLLLAAVLVPALEHAEVPLTMAGSLMLGSAHLWRWRSIHRADQKLLDEHSV